MHESSHNFANLHITIAVTGLNDLMKGNPNIVGDSAAFDWKKLDDALAGSASRNNHAVFRVICHFPGQENKVPQYLLDAGIDMRWYSGGRSPYYGDAKLQEALEQFVRALGRRYDGDKRIGWIQAGLLGFWGEWVLICGELNRRSESVFLTHLLLLPYSRGMAHRR
jgi:hypothetical protein